MIDWGEALGVLIGVIVGGVLTGGVSFLLDRQRRAHDDRVRQERWQREDSQRADERRRADALDNRRHLRDLFVRTFVLVNYCESAVDAIGRTRPDASPYEAREHEDQRVAAIERLELHRRELLMIRAEFDVIAPRDTVGACDQMIDAINNVIWHSADNPREDQARAADDVQAFAPTVERFRACVRRDLGIREPQ